MCLCIVCACNYPDSCEEEEETKQKKMGNKKNLVIITFCDTVIIIFFFFAFSWYHFLPVVVVGCLYLLFCCFLQYNSSGTSFSCLSYFLLFTFSFWQQSNNIYGQHGREKKILWTKMKRIPEKLRIL